MRIFISYRRIEDDRSYIVGQIHERLAAEFGTENVFRDTSGIHGGQEWRSVLRRELHACKIMLVVIGPDWSGLTNDAGQKRLMDPNDVTRWEVEAGLQLSREGQAAVIPLLVLDAKVPKRDDLPESLQPLLEKNVVRLRNYPDFHRDFETLVHDIRLSLGYSSDDISIDHYEPKTIQLSAGPFLMGSPQGSGAPANECPQHAVTLPAYRIGIYPVTNSQYEEFVREKHIPVAPVMGWDGQRVPAGLETHPVTGVTWYEALAYCQWLSEKTGRSYSLPNEAQWEKACRGGNGYLYPWGNDLEAGRSNHGCESIAAVDAYPAQNEYGCFDMVGNVRQWTCSLWGEKRSRPDARYLYPWKDDHRNSISANRQIRRVVRGSSMRDAVTTLRCSARSGQLPDDPGLPGLRGGFRVVINLEE